MSVVLLLSGGLDSTVLGCHLAAQGHAIRGLALHYGQDHARELSAAAAVCRDRGWILVRRTLPALQRHQSDIPDGHYTDPSMRATVFPNRNMVLLAHAVAYAMEYGAELVAYAAHGGDHTIYPDCRPEFVAAMTSAIRTGNWDPPQLIAPFLSWSKADIVREGARIQAPMHLTYSCYRGAPRHCGTCGTCYERREAFTLAGISDPTDYEEAPRCAPGQTPGTTRNRAR